jgi:catechol 2,3-dioxygenase-like lactoylglutathione lyase family enzyme
MLNHTRIDTTIPVVDMKRARRFYADTLGLEEIDSPDGSFSEGNAVFQVGDCTRFMLYQRPERTKAEHTIAAFTVDDLEQSVDDLKQRGVRFERYDMPNLKTDERGIAADNGMKAAWFRDTEGNVLSLGEM